MVKEVKNAAFKVMKFFKVVDPDKNLSLTNLAVWVVLFKLATASEAVSPVDVGALVSTLLSYQAKKYIGKMKNNNPEAVAGDDQS